MSAKRLQGLEPMPSLAELRAMYERRTGKALEDTRPGGVGVVRGCLPDQLRADLTRCERRYIRAETVPGRSFAHAFVGDAFSGERVGDALALRFNFPPRTKKNGTTLGIRQKRAYRLYRDAIIRVIQPVREQLGLPLPEHEYNIRATYYVDRFGERADKCGLDQGLYDALENAGVVANDWCFRTDDGTRIVAGDERPRVELVITKIDGAA